MAEYNKDKFKFINDQFQFTDSSTASSQKDNTPKSNPDTPIVYSKESTTTKLKKINKSTSVQCDTIIKEVYQDNFFEEIEKIGNLIDDYNYIGMDTEFPGIVYIIDNLGNDFYYKTLKLNADSLKIIQLGITITNEKGEYPHNLPYHVWQFNFEFDIDKDIQNKDSIELLKKSGINFEKLKKNGINHKIFAEYLITSGLVLNPDVHWVSFQGSYDFGYLLKLLTNESLPNTEEEYISKLSLYFNNYYDVKILLKDMNYYFNGGLNKLIYKLGVRRKGTMHQAGSDSIATIDSFWSLINNGIVSKDKIKNFKNVLYGLGLGRDNKNTINYTNFNNCHNSMNCNNNTINEINKKQNESCNNSVMINSQVMSNIVYNNSNNFKVGCFCPVVFVNVLSMINKNNMINYTNNEIISQNISFD